MSNSLWPHGLHHTRLPCLSLSPRVCPDPCPLSQWYYLTFSFSAVPFSFYLKSLQAPGVFPMNWLFPSSGQRIGASGLASVLAMNTQDWSPLGWTGLTSLQSKGLPRVFSNTTVQKHQFLGAQPSLWSNSHIHTWYRVNHSFDYVIKVIIGNWCLCFFNMLFRFDHSFSSKEQASFNFMGAVTIHSDPGAQENQICHCSHFPHPTICHKVLRPDAMILVLFFFFHLFLLVGG